MNIVSVLLLSLLTIGCHHKAPIAKLPHNPEIILSWKYNLPADFFRVYRMELDDKTDSVIDRSIATVSSNKGVYTGNDTTYQYTDKSVISGHFYWYTVTTVYKGNESSRSKSIGAPIPVTSPIIEWYREE